MEAVRDVLRKSLRRSLEAIPVEDRLAAAWLVTCGATMAQRGGVVGLRDGVLHVSVADPAWLLPLRSISQGLARELASLAGVPVSEIRFELQSSSLPIQGDGQARGFSER